MTNFGSTNVSVIDTATNKVMGPQIPVGINPVSVAFTPDGTHAYVANSGSFAFNGNVSVIATASNTVVATVPVGPNPVRVAIAPDGTRAYVTNFGAYSVSVIDTMATPPAVVAMSRWGVPPAR